jgi:hypothetical protein
MTKQNENIFFSIIDNDVTNQDDTDDNIYNNNDNNTYEKLLSNELSQMLDELDDKNGKLNLNYNENVAKNINYTLNYKLKDLYLICEYYNLLKEVKQNKYNKDEIVNLIVNFENNINNTEIVFKRMNMWFYINELKNDKFMKKFVLF